MASKKRQYQAGQALTLDEAKSLKPGTTLYHRVNRNSDGSCQRWRVNGQVKTWKHDAGRVQIPVKNGLYVTEAYFDVLSLTEEEVLSE